MIPKIRGPLLPYMEPGSFHVSRGSAYSSVFLCHNVVSPFLLLAVINTDTLYNHTGEFTSALKKKAKQKYLLSHLLFGQVLLRKPLGCKKEAKTLQWGNVVQALTAPHIHSDSWIHLDL